MATRARRRSLGFWSYVWVYGLLLYAPLIILAAFSFNRSPILALPWSGFSLRWYRAILHSPGLMGALGTSLLVATVSSIIAMVIGGLLGAAVTRFRFPGRGMLLAIALVPLVIPFLGLAVAMLLTFLTVGLKPSSLAVILAHSVVFIPTVLLLIGTRLLGVEPALEEAALDLGATWPRIARRIYVPLMRPALIAGLISSFIGSFNEFYLALFLSGPNVTLPVYFFSGFRDPNLLPPALALSTLVTVVILAIVGIASGVQLARGARVGRSRFKPVSAVDKPGVA